MNWLQALILGIVQGLTEYLPVSSSGHLEIANFLFGNTGADNLTFDITVHVATVCSTLVILRKEIAGIISGLFKFKMNKETEFFLKICVSLIPIFIVGIFFKDYIENLFGNGLFLVGICLIITSLLLTFSYYARPRKKEKIGWADSFIIGIAQAIAVMPGISRSGSTISTGIILGNNKEKTAKFSFLMVIVPILGEAFLEVIDLIKGEEGAISTNIPPLSLIIGFITAFISGCIACKWMLNIVKKGKLIWFAVYCAFIGIVAIALNFYY